jgi:hypothetical protein
MKAIFSLIVLAAMATALVFPLTEHTALAQAPTGPQPRSQPQQNPAPAKTPDASQKPPDAGVAIAVAKGRPEALACVTAFLDKAKRSGAIKRAFERAGLAHLNVAS